MKNCRNTFFNLERKRGKDILWNRIRTSKDDRKYDIDSKLQEQNFYSNLFESEGWDRDDAKYLTDFIVYKLNNDVLDIDITSEEIHDAIKSMEQNKSPEQYGIIAELYFLYRDEIRDNSFMLMNKIYEESSLSLS